MALAQTSSCCFFVCFNISDPNYYPTYANSYMQYNSNISGKNLYFWFNMFQNLAYKSMAFNLFWSEQKYFYVIYSKPWIRFLAAGLFL